MRALAGLCVAIALAGCGSRGPAPQPKFAMDCLEAARLAEAGEHKPAVDMLAAARDRGVVCEPSVLAAVAASERTLGQADGLLFRGLEAKRAGHFAEARRSLREALHVYPKYYWAQKLLRDLPPEGSPEEPALRQRAVDLLASGRPGEALAALDKAARLAPEDSDDIRRLRTEIGELSLAQAHRAQHDGT